MIEVTLSVSTGDYAALEEVAISNGFSTVEDFLQDYVTHVLYEE